MSSSMRVSDGGSHLLSNSPTAEHKSQDEGSPVGAIYDITNDITDLQVN